MAHGTDHGSLKYAGPDQGNTVPKGSRSGKPVEVPVDGTHQDDGQNVPADLTNLDLDQLMGIDITGDAPLPRPNTNTFNPLPGTPDADTAPNGVSAPPAPSPVPAATGDGPDPEGPQGEEPSLDLVGLDLETLMEIAVGGLEEIEDIALNGDTSLGGAKFDISDLGALALALGQPLSLFSAGFAVYGSGPDSLPPAEDLELFTDTGGATTGDPATTTIAGAASPVNNAPTATGPNLIEGGPGDDTLTGTPGNDTIFGYGGNDTLIGLAGADSLDGGIGTDTADYSGSLLGITVSLATGTGSGGDAQGDTLVNIENLTGSAFNDVLTGDANANLLSGGAGNDTLDGGAGNDMLIGGAGADSLDGGTGTDTADYSASGAGVMVDLAAGTGSGGDAQGDTLVNVENLIGSAFDDTFIGDANANDFNGGDGTDTVDYSGSGAGVTVDLVTGTGSGGDAAGDTLTGIENLIGSAFDDTLTGNNNISVFDGGAGNDTLTGGNGDDTLDGGAGDDTLIAGFGDDTLTGGIGNDILDSGKGDDTLDGGAGDDTLIAGFGDDTLTGGIGNDILDSGKGDDILVWDSLDLTIDGGAGSDTLRVDSGDADLSAFAGSITGIEVIDLESDTGANTVTLDAQDVLDMSDTNTVTVTGDAGDSVNAGTGWTDGGISGGFHTYTQGLATLLVDTDIAVNADIIA